MDDIKPVSDDDTGVSPWVLLLVVVAVVGLLSVPLLWLIQSLIVDDPGETAPTPPAIEVSETVPPSDPVNLALLKPVKAPGSYQSVASAFVDGDYSRGWNSGGFPPQWIEVDLTAPSMIRTIRLRTGQSPAGETIHVVLGWGPDETKARVLHVFEGHTTDRQWLSHTPDTPWQDVQFIRIETIASPSWVAWFELETIGWAN